MASSTATRNSGSDQICSWALFFSCTASTVSSSPHELQYRAVGALTVQHRWHCFGSRTWLTFAASGGVIPFNSAVARQFVSTGATRRVLQATAIDADLEIAIVGFAGDGRPVLLGITERLDFVDAPAHAADLARYRAISRPFSGSLVLEVPAVATVVDLVEVYPPSVRSVDLSGVTVRVNEDSGPRPPVPPAPTVTTSPVSGGTVSLTMADGEIEVYELVRQPA